MKTKILIILIVALFLGAGGFFTFEKFISPGSERGNPESSLSDICRKVTTVNEKNYCLAIVNNDDSFCLKIDILGERKICQAVINEDPLYCRDIQEIEPRNMCFNELAEITNNIDYCDETGDQELCYFNFISNLYWSSEERQIKNEYCDKFSAKSPERYTCLALKEKDVSFCEGENSACLTLFESDLSFCDDIKPEDKIKCIRDRAIINEDPAICEKALDLDIKDECYFGYVSHFNPDISLCENIKNEQLKNMCYVEGAISLFERGLIKDGTEEENMDIEIEEQKTAVEGSNIGESMAEEITCEEYCKAKTHDACSGNWEISGTYPNCVCNYKCLTNDLENIVKEEGFEEEENDQAETNTQEEITLGPLTNWDTFHGNSARTGFSSSKAPAEPNILWEWKLKDFRSVGYSGDFDTNWLIIENNKIFIALENIFVLDLKTGEKLWTFVDEDGKFYPRGLTIGDNKLFATVNKGGILSDLPPGFVYAFDKNSGEFLWKYQTQKGISHSLPVFSENKVFVGDDSGTVYAIDVAGNLVWKKYLENSETIHSSPAVSDGIVFVGTEGTARSNVMPSHLYALNAKTGEEIWRFKIDYISGKLNLIHSTPVVLDGVVYIGSENGYFYAVSADSGKLIWKKLIASGSDQMIGMSSAAAVGYGKIFIGTYEGKFLSLSQDNGEIIWEYNFGKANADASPLLADEKVYFGTGEGGDGSFYCFDANSGSIIWKRELGGSSPALASGVLVIQNAWLEESLNPETPVIISYF